MAEAHAGHIVALGGGGFSMEPNNPLLDDFIIGLSRRQPARVCFVPTASGDSAPYIARFYRAFSGKCIPTDLTFNDPQSLPRRPSRSTELADFVAQQDVFYVGGGNTAHLIAIWRTHGLDALLHKAWTRGAVLSGISAGMLCWFQDGLTDSFGGLEPLNGGLGFVEGSACPHYDGESERRAAYHKYVASGGRSGYAVDDGAALHFCGSTMEEIVSSRPAASAYRVEAQHGRVVETQLPVRFLGTGQTPSRPPTPFESEQSPGVSHIG